MQLWCCTVFIVRASFLSWILQSNDVSKKADLTKLISSEDKLADVFTPQSRRHAATEQLSNISNDDKLTEADDAQPTRRHSSRLSAKAALDAISRSVEVLVLCIFRTEVTEAIG